MRDNKWWLRGLKLVPRSSLTRIIPRADYANAPPLLPLDPVVDSKAVHNMGAYSVDEGNDEWFLGRDDYLNENAATQTDGARDEWDWTADDGGYIDATMEIDDASQSAFFDPGTLAASDDIDPFVSAEAYDDPTIDLAEASVGPVQPNAPPLDRVLDADEWDFFEETIPLQVVPGGYLQSDEPALARSDEWFDDDASDETLAIVDDDDDALPPDPVVIDQGADDAWPWTQDEVDDPIIVDEPAGITLEVLAYQDEYVEPEVEPDDWWHALDAWQDPSELASQTEWPWGDDDTGDDLQCIVDDDDDAAGPDQPPMPVDDAWPWLQDDVGEPFELTEEPAGITLEALPYSEEFPPDQADDDLTPLLDATPQTAAVVSEQQPQDDPWSWESEQPTDVVPSSYLQADAPPVLPGLLDAHWHWDSDAVEDEWSEAVEPVGPNGATGANVAVLGDPHNQNLLRRRDDFQTTPPYDEPWIWHQIEPDEAWWPEAIVTPADFNPLAALAQPDPWDWEGETSVEDWLLPQDPIPAPLPIDPNVLGVASQQNLLRRRDDFQTNPPRDHDWDYQLEEPSEEWELGSGPVVPTQVLFLEYPPDDGYDHFPPDPDNDWVEASAPVGADAAPALPRVSEEHDWKQWEDGEGDYEIEPSQPVDAPGLAQPDGWHWDEETVTDDAWMAFTGDFQNPDFFALAGPPPVDQAWHWDGESTDADSWWTALTTPDTDGTTGVDTCPLLLSAALARIAELEAELAECRAHHGDGGGGGAGGDGDDNDHGHHHHHRGEDDEQRRILDNREREKRARIDRNNALIMAIVAATVHGLKGPDK